MREHLSFGLPGIFTALFCPGRDACDDSLATLASWNDETTHREETTQESPHAPPVAPVRPHRSSRPFHRTRGVRRGKGGEPARQRHGGSGGRSEGPRFPTSRAGARGA